MSAKQTPLFEYHEIASLLPHRYPFQFIDRVLEFEDGRRIVALKNVSINEPFFRGHFPEQPQRQDAESPIGPLRIELGFPLNPHVGDDRQAVMFSFGAPP